MDTLKTITTMEDTLKIIIMMEDMIIRMEMGTHLNKFLHADQAHRVRNIQFSTFLHSENSPNYNYGYNKPPPVVNNPPPPHRGTLPTNPPRSNPPSRGPIPVTPPPQRSTYETPSQVSSHLFGVDDKPPRNNYNAQPTTPPANRQQNLLQGMKHVTPRNQSGERTVSEKISDYLVNNGAKVFFIGLWFSGNIAFFTWKFYGLKIFNINRKSGSTDRTLPFVLRLWDLEDHLQEVTKYFCRQRFTILKEPLNASNLIVH